MKTVGLAGDIIVSLFIALGQMIEPLDSDVVNRIREDIDLRNSCEHIVNFETQYKQKKCRKLKKKDKEKYKENCKTIDEAIKQCKVDRLNYKVVGYRPKPLDVVLRMSNIELLHELNIICSAAQDRTSLKMNEWGAGKFVDRSAIGSDLLLLKNSELQKHLDKKILEAADGDFKLKTVGSVLFAICHWRVDRAAISNKVDFLPGIEYLKKLIAELPNIDELPRLKQASFILDAKGQRVDEIFEKEFVVRDGERFIKRAHRRRNADPDEFPKQLFQAFIAIEDQRFMDHNGVDFSSFERVKTLASQGVTQGGSTFTMQLVKNAFFVNDLEKERKAGRRSLNRKIKELLMLPLVESRYSKEEILAYYLNLIDLTPRAQGVKMASIDLFGKSRLKDLELHEMALLAAMPKGPSRYNPRRNPERAKLRRDTVLRVMEEQEYITKKEKADAQAMPLGLVSRGPVDEQKALSYFYTGHVQRLFAQKRRQAGEGSDWSFGGIDLQTSMNSSLQRSVIKAVQNGLSNYEKRMGRYKYRPLIDSETKEEKNISKLVERLDGDWALALRRLEPSHPYPDTGWVQAIKVGDRWGLANGETVSVRSIDRQRFRQKKEFALVVLAPQKDSKGRYRLIAPPRVQGAAVVMDIETGEVLAMSGGYSAGAFGLNFNRATRAYRQPGSTAKPLTYLYALNGGMTPRSLVTNQKVIFPKYDGCPGWEPENSSGGGVRMRMTNALAASVNRAMVGAFLEASGVKYNRRSSNSFVGRSEAMKQIYETHDEVYDLGSALGFYDSIEKIVEQNKNRDDEKKRKLPCIMSLLGAYETTPLHVAQGYGTIGNGGLHRPATFIRQAFQNGKPLIVDQSESLRKMAEMYHQAGEQGMMLVPEAFGALPNLRPESVRDVKAMLMEVVKRGTATGISYWGGKVAGKTGTTNDAVDTWFAGFNSKIAIAVWVGYDDRKEFANLGRGQTGASVALPIFTEIMKSFYELFPEEQERYIDVESFKGD